MKRQPSVCRRTGLAPHAVNKVMQAFARAGLVKELTGQKRNRLYSYDRCLSILSEGTEPLTNFS